MQPKLNIITKHVTCTLDKYIAQEIQTLLDKDVAVEDAGSDEIMNTFTVDFGDGIQVDINFINTDSGPYLDAILFNQGSEVYVAEPSWQLVGEYDLMFGDTQYILTIKEKQ